MKRGRFSTALQRQHACRALGLIARSAGSISQHQYQRAYDETIEAQKHLIIVLGIADEETYFPKATSGKTSDGEG